MSLLKKITRKASTIAGVFFRYPGTKLELELVPIDTSERASIYDQCKIETPVRGFRQKDVTHDEDMFCDLLVDRVAKSARGATVGCLKQILILDDAALKEHLGLEEITDESPVAIDIDDIKYLMKQSIDFKVWLNGCLNNMEAFNAALRAQAIKNS
jgi:hypothetical protein